MAVWPYSHNLAIWLHSHMALWLWLYPRWVYTERAIKMLHCGQKIKLIRPFCEKWEPKCSAGIFSFVFFRISFVKQKVDVGRLGSKKMLWCIKWNVLRIGFYLIIAPKKNQKWWGILIPPTLIHHLHNSLKNIRCDKCRTIFYYFGIQIIILQ